MEEGKGVAGANTEPVDCLSWCLTRLLSERTKERIWTACFSSPNSCVHWTCWRTWRIWVTAILVLLYILFVILWTAALSYGFYRGPTGPFSAWYVAAIFVMLNVGVTLLALREHWVNYSQPYQQKYIIRVSFLVVVYGYLNWLSLRFPEGYVYFNMILELYEAFAFYSFFKYWVHYLEVNHGPLSVTMATRQPFKHRAPCTLFLPVYIPSRRLVLFTKCCVLQLCIVRLILSTTGIITRSLNIYKQGQLVADGFYLYDTIIGSISQIICGYSLYILYEGTQDLLAPIRPRCKLVFMNLLLLIPALQGLLINGLVKYGVIPSDEFFMIEYGFGEQTTIGIPCFINTIIMFPFSVWFYQLFSYKRYINPSRSVVPFVTGCIKAFGDTSTIQLHEGKRKGYGSAIQEGNPSSRIDITA